MARRAVNEAIWLLNADNSVSAPASGSVTFYERGGTALATIYSAASGGTALPNPRPVTNGYATGYIDTGSYDLVASANGLTSGTVEWEALRGDSVESATQIIRAGSTSAQIVAAFATQADGQRFTFEESDAYSLSNVEIDVTADIIVDAERATITQTGDLKSIFVVKADVNPTIRLRRGILTGDRYDAADDGAYQGLERKAIRCAAVFHGGDGGNIWVGDSQGFYAAVSRYPWATGSTTLKAEGTRVKGGTIRVEDCSGGDMGILCSGVKDPDFFVRGSFTPHSTSIHPPHLLYHTPTRSSRGGKYTVIARDGDPLTEGIGGGTYDNVAHAAQFKNCTGEFEVYAEGCHGVLELAYGASMTGRAVGRDMLASPTGAVTFDLTTATPTGCRVDADVSFAAGESDTRACLVDGTDNHVTLIVDADLDDASSDYYTVLRGTKCELDVTVRNAGTAGRRGARVQSGSGNRLTVREARNVPYAYVVDSGATDTVVRVPEPAKITLNTNGRVGIVNDASTLVNRAASRKSITISATGSTVVDPGLSDVLEVNITTTSAVTLSGIDDTDTPVGGRFGVEIVNGSGGTLNLTWGGTFSGFSGVAVPANGARRIYWVRNNGTNWVLEPNTGIGGHISDDATKITFSSAVVDYWRATVSTNHTITDAEYGIPVNTDAARTIALPAATGRGKRCLVADVAGTGATTHNITINRAGSDTIVLPDGTTGATSVAIARTRGALEFINVQPNVWVARVVTPIA